MISSICIYTGVDTFPKLYKSHFKHGKYIIHEFLFLLYRYNMLKVLNNGCNEFYISNTIQILERLILLLLKFSKYLTYLCFILF